MLTPGHLAGEESPGYTETQANLTAIAEGRKPKFAAYKHDSVKSALNALFGRKCAYCESLTPASVGPLHTSTRRDYDLLSAQVFPKPTASAELGIVLQVVESQGSLSCTFYSTA
ncbi:hypothetical protein P3T43_006611 [Paraburkholderia sp. GAS41]